MISLKIDSEFQNKIPQMPKEDFDGLKEDILRDGYVRDPLVVWKEENTLLDGHNRWKVIQENFDLLGDKFKVDYKSFPDRYACIAWICANQLHKHNMNESQRDKLIQEEYDARQKSWGAQTGNTNAKKQSGENLHSVFENFINGSEINVVPKNHQPTTRMIIAKEHNIPEGAVKAAVEFGRGVDKGEEIAPGFKDEILSGVIKASKGDVASLRNMKPEERKEAVGAIRNGERLKPKGFTKAARNDKAQLDEIIAEMYSPEIKPFTIEMLEGDIEINGMEYVKMLRNTLVDRSTLLVGDNRARVAKKIDEIINEIKKIKELVK